MCDRKSAKHCCHVRTDSGRKKDELDPALERAPPLLPLDLKERVHDVRTRENYYWASQETRALNLKTGRA